MFATYLPDTKTLQYVKAVKFQPVSQLLVDFHFIATQKTVLDNSIDDLYFLQQLREFEKFLKFFLGFQ